MEGQLRTAGVSAEQVLRAVRVHLDRVHDLVRRLGCEPETATQVVEASALELVRSAADRPDGVTGLVGRWFALARVTAAEVATHDPDDLPVGGGLLPVDEDQARLAELLDRLPEDERTALLVHDAYALPPASASAALGLEEHQSAALAVRARAALARLLDGELAAPADPQSLVAGLAVVALPEGTRTRVLSRVQSTVRSTLPDGAAVAPVEPLPSRLLSPLVVLVGIVLAAAVGLAVGVLLLQGGSAPALVPASDQVRALPSSPGVSAPAPSALPGARTALPEPTTSVFLVSPAQPVADDVPAAEPPLAVEPPSGGNGAELLVVGTGWTAGAELLVEYLGPGGRATGSRTTAVADADGRFSADLLAEDPDGEPGPHVVRASDGTRTLDAPYDAAE